MIVKQTVIPDNSILNKDEDLFNYIDSFQSVFLEKGQSVDIVKFGKLLLSSGPKWVDPLMAIRNKIVTLFGLKTSKLLTERENQLDNFKFEPGEQLGIFKLFIKTENEIVLGEDDKHLNFRVSLLIDHIVDEIERKKLTITTAVKFNNIFGRLYFLPVKPIHKLIVRATLKEIIQQIENESNTYKQNG